MGRLDFERTLLESVDEGLSSQGELSKLVVSYHAQEGFRLRKHEFPFDVEAFAEALRGILGQGTGFLEKTIAKKFGEKTAALPAPGFPDQDSVEYVAHVRRELISKGVD